MTDAARSQPGHVAAPRGSHAAPPDAPGAAIAVTQPRPLEPPELRYLREIRHAVVFIAVVVGLMCALSLIIGIVAAVQLSKVSSELRGNGSSSSSNCLSQGGTDPSC